MESWAATKAVIKVKTFQIIVLQGIIGSLPWTAMVFFTMWFELIGEHEASFSMLMFPNYIFLTIVLQVKITNKLYE